MAERTDERRDLYWKQLDRASNDVRGWPDYLKTAFPKPAAPAADRPPQAGTAQAERR